MIDSNTKFNEPKTKGQVSFKRFLDKLKKTASNFRIIPSNEYNPKPKQMSRRDRIRAGLQKRNQTCDNAIKILVRSS